MTQSLNVTRSGKNGLPVQLLQQWCNVVVTTDAIDQSRCRVENGLQSAKLTVRKFS